MESRIYNNEDVLILSKTHMSEGICCIGGMVIGSGRYVRLLTPAGSNQPENTDLKIRQVWEVEFTERPDIRPPHTEDVLVNSRKIKESLKDEITILEFIKERKVQIWKGSPDILFDGKIQWKTRGGRGFIDNKAIPEHSVGFWISDKDLTKEENERGTFYGYPDINGNGRRYLKFIGFEPSVNKIPAGTLLRVSLARWWKPENNKEIPEKVCFLNLSGWYDLNETRQKQ